MWQFSGGNCRPSIFSLTEHWHSREVSDITCGPQRSCGFSSCGSAPHNMRHVNQTFLTGTTPSTGTAGSPQGRRQPQPASCAVTPRRSTRTAASLDIRSSPVPRFGTAGFASSEISHVPGAGCELQGKRLELVALSSSVHRAPAALCRDSRINSKPPHCIQLVSGWVRGGNHLEAAL